MEATDEETGGLTVQEEQAIAEIARRCLGIKTLETRRSDAADFHSVAVWNVREALIAAYEAGRGER